MTEDTPWSGDTYDPNHPDPLPRSSTLDGPVTYSVDAELREWLPPGNRVWGDFAGLKITGRATSPRGYLFFEVDRGRPGFLRGLQAGWFRLHWFQTVFSDGQQDVEIVIRYGSNQSITIYRTVLDRVWTTLDFSQILINGPSNAAPFDIYVTVSHKKQLYFAGYSGLELEALERRS